MFIHNIDPVAFSIGGWNIYYYGLVYALGFLATYFFLWWQIRKGQFKLTVDQLDTLFIYLILGVVVGGRVGEFIFFQPARLISDPLSIFYIWQGGMAFHGGVIGVMIAIWLFCKKYGKRFYDITDRIVIPVSMVMFFGRIANFVNAELVGRVTDVSWAVNFNNETANGELVYRHPSQIYEALQNLITAGVLYAVQLQREWKPGFISWLFVLLYGLFRIFTNLWRDDVLWFFGILGTGQLLSLVMVGVASYILFRYYRGEVWTSQ